MNNLRALIFIFGFVGLLDMAWAAADCPYTSYKKTGQSCRSIGLDSNKAICRGGDIFAQLCDDTKQGLIRHCDSSQRCQTQSNQPVDSHAGQWDGEYVFYKGNWRHCSQLRFNKKRKPRGYCERDHKNTNCRRSCEYVGNYGNNNNSGHHNGYDNHYDERYNDGAWRGDQVYYQGRWRACQSLEYKHDRPVRFCANGRKNRDCRGRCESRGSYW